MTVSRKGEQKTEFSFRTLTFLWQPVAVMRCYAAAVLTTWWLLGILALAYKGSR
jgi:hypothetical protein